LLPLFLRSTGLGPFFSAERRADRGGVDDHAAEIDRVRLAAQLVQQQPVQTRPHARVDPLAQAVPQRHATAAHLLREVFPLDAGLEHEQDPRQAQAVRLARLPTFGAGRVHRQDRLDLGPQLVGHQQLAHGVLRDNDARDYVR